MSTNTHAVHPRVKERLEDTIQRRIATFTASRDSTRAGLERAIALLAHFNGTLDVDATVRLRSEAEGLRDELDRVAADVLPNSHRIDDLTARLFRFAEALNALKPVLSSRESA
jgi:hypothetical protein